MTEHSLGMSVVSWVAWGTGIVGVGVLTWGVLVGVFELARLEVHRMRGQDIAQERAVVRQDLGYYILLGLEFLIAADIMHTIRNPNLEELAVLGGIVAIRTVISHFVTREMQESGRLAKERRGEKSAETQDGQSTD